MRSFIQKTIPPLLILCLLAGTWLAWHLAQTTDEQAVPEQAETGRRMVVELPEGKLASAGIETAQVELRKESVYASIPGRVTYDQTRHIHVRVATPGVITRLLVKPGDSVEKDQLLATMSSPEVGLARADSLQRSSELEIARRKLAWEEARRTALDKMVSAIESRVALAEIRKASADEQLGAIREQLLSKYSDFLLSESLLSRTQAVVSSGALAGKTARERQSQFESANSSLQGTIEQARHDTAMSFRSAKSASEDAQRRFSISVQQVVTLLGITSTANSEPPLEYKPSENLSLVEIRSPLKGTIEQRILSESERALAGDAIFVLANTDLLWISAQVRESQWSSLDLKPEDRVSVSLPAFPNQQFETFVCFLGREVDPTTNAIPLVLSIENSSGRLRPGLFVRVHLPLGKPEERLLIPESALAQHEGEAFVFRPIATDKFERVNVRTGIPRDGWVEVKQGLKVGERIVTRGTFVLKSELLLESEE